MDLAIDHCAFGAKTPAKLRSVGACPMVVQLS
jgi:hypothetical protein